MKIRALLMALLPAAAAVAADISYNPGTNISRTMILLGTSTPEKPNTVRLLFYGQSISEQIWHLEVDADLRARFPHANIIMENRARGGCASDCLVNYVDDDVYTFNPTLVIFHVYGSHTYYEQIISMMRSHLNPDGSKPEVLIHNDHYTGPGPWEDLMSWTYVPGYANTYKCGFIDVRTKWIAAVNANCGGDPHCYLSDDVHLNYAGNALLASYIKPYLYYDPNSIPSSPINPWPADKDANSSTNANITWTPGLSVDSQDLYFGKSAPPTFIANLSASTGSLDPGALDPNATYYWQVNGRNEHGVKTGPLWRFKTSAAGGTGLIGEYFNNSDFTEPAAVRRDRIVDFNWMAEPPCPEMAADTFSIRWSGQVQPPATQTWTFYTYTDDGVRLWVDGELLIDKWQNQAATEWSGAAALTADQKYDVVMEYYDNSGDATVELRWSSPGQSKQIIPQARLYPYRQAGDVDGDYEVDLADAKAFCEQWLTAGEPGDPNSGDLNQGGFIDSADFAIMGENWGL